MFTVFNTKDTSLLVLRRLDYISLQNFFLVWFVPKERRDYLRKLLIVDAVFFHERVGNMVVNELLPGPNEYWRPQFYEREVVRDLYRESPDPKQWTQRQCEYMKERDRVNAIKAHFKGELMLTVSLSSLQSALKRVIHVIRFPPKTTENVEISNRKIFHFWLKRASENQVILVNHLIKDKMEEEQHDEERPNKRQCI